MENRMSDRELREYLAQVLEGRGAHISFEQAIADVPPEKMGTRLPGLEHSLWGLVYHMEACLRDIIEYIRYIDYRFPDYPSGLWPERDAPASTQEWTDTVAAVTRGIGELREMVLNEENDLFAPFPHSAEHNLFREAITAADHNSYHIGQIVDLRMLLDIPVRDY
jgi:hypothetical protein